MAFGLTTLTFFKASGGRFRKTFYMWALSSWFICPEWGSAYVYPAKSLSELIDEEMVKAPTPAPEAIVTPEAAAEKIDEMKKTVEDIVNNKK